jgi:hypothetical protein
VTTKIIAPLGRPISNAVVNIYWFKSVSTNDVRQIDLVKLISDRNGIVKGIYDEKSVPKGRDIWAEVSKDGYSGYGTTEWQPEFVLKRKFKPADVDRIASLQGAAQVRELRELLAGDFEYGLEDPSLEELVFAHEHTLRPALRALVRDPRVGTKAGGELAFIGVPDDIRLFLEYVPSPKTNPSDNGWAYDVAAALLEPATAREWTFLHNCAINDYDDLWAVNGAIQSLKLIASPKSKQFLEEAGRRDSNPNCSASAYVDDIQAAIKYIESGPAPLSDEDLVVAGQKVAQAIKIGKWKGNKPPQYNDEKDKALITCEFIDGRDLLFHIATFHKVDGKWRLRGVREMKQVLLATAPETDSQPDEKK